MRHYVRYVKPIILLFAILISFSSCNIPMSFGFPTITYGEFPFRVEYKLEGSDEIFVIEDTLICEFRGIKVRPRGERFSLGNGINLYEESLMSGQEEFTIVDNDNFTVKYEMGTGGYYLKDYYSDGDFIANHFIVYKNQSIIDDISPGENGWTEKLKNYGVYIVKYECANPVDNNYEYRYPNKNDCIYPADKN